MISWCSHSVTFYIEGWNLVEISLWTWRRETWLPGAAAARDGNDAVIFIWKCMEWAARQTHTHVCRDISARFQHSIKNETVLYSGLPGGDPQGFPGRYNKFVGRKSTRKTAWKTSLFVWRLSMLSRASQVSRILAPAAPNLVLQSPQKFDKTFPVTRCTKISLKCENPSRTFWEITWKVTTRLAVNLAQYISI